jgi:hypothetical protein
VVTLAKLVALILAKPDVRVDWPAHRAIYKVARLVRLALTTAPERAVANTHALIASSGALIGVAALGIAVAVPVPAKRHALTAR